MGLFLAFNSIAGKSAAEVTGSLTRFLQQSGGSLSLSSNVAATEDGCSILEANGNTTILFPDSFMQWDDAAAFISEDLQAPVFSFHIHDSDLWMYILYVNGTDEDQFNPVPEYWDDTIDEDERNYWKGDTGILASFLPHINIADIEKYLVHWDADMDPETKAYPDDEYNSEDLQLFDFMRKLQLPIPLNDSFEPAGTLYRLVSNQEPVQSPGADTDHSANTSIPEITGKKKPWWKFW
jgi:hypothetical protein